MKNITLNKILIKFSTVLLMTILLLSSCKEKSDVNIVNVDSQTLQEITVLCDSYLQALGSRNIEWIKENFDPELVNSTGYSVEDIVDIGIQNIDMYGGIRRSKITDAALSTRNITAPQYRVKYQLKMKDGSEIHVQFLLLSHSVAEPLKILDVYF